MTPGSSTQLKIVHTTGYAYQGEVQASFNEARLTPRSEPDQLVVHHRVEISPTAWTHSYQDYWGSSVTAFELNERHSEMTVTGASTVQVGRAPAQAAGTGWDDLPAVRDRFAELLMLSDAVLPPADLLERAAALRARAATPTDLARAVCDLLHDEVTYLTGATEVTTTAADAWTARSGVCQDMAHLCLGVLRSHGLPARYVSGYLHPSEDPEVGATVRGESHAWVEWWDGDWVAFDPTNDAEVGNRHVVVARGREYADVPPLRGIFAGGEAASMFVEVQLTRLA